jgi:hypothetical protein
MRSLAESPETLSVDRRGYQDQKVVIDGRIGELVRRDLQMLRVPAPCCDLRGRWHIEMQLDSPAMMYKHPKGRAVSGDVTLGPRTLPPEEGDDLDSLVRIVRGLHTVDFKPFFGGPVAPDVSRTIFGGGPDLFHEVRAEVPSGDSVSMTFIPRMTHGSIWFSGRLQGDTVRGKWTQMAYAGGAEGHFVMTRLSPPDTAQVTVHPNPSFGFRRGPRADKLPADIPAGQVPTANWRPELAVAPGGRLWLAPGGLFTADSLYGAWHRVLGSNADPVDADELRIGIRLAFVDSRVILLGLSSRYPMESAPLLYRTTDGGTSWAAVPFAGVRRLDALEAIGRSVWLAVTQVYSDTTLLLKSSDGGATWARTLAPDSMVEVTGFHRISLDTAFASTAGREHRPALWRTVDGGVHWTTVPTPADQRLQRVPAYMVRVEDIATVGKWIIVREAGRVFASPRDDIRWHALPSVMRVASERGAPRVFALVDSLRPAMLDADLKVEWQASSDLASRGQKGVEQVLMANGHGFISTDGSIFEAGPGIDLLMIPRKLP